MSACEKCWADAYMRSRETGTSQTEAYQALLLEREARQCSPQQQAGQFWDAERGCDSRTPETGASSTKKPS